jgi:hypothetical protein
MTTWQRSIQAAVRALRKEEAVLQKQLEALQTKIAELEEMARSGAVTKLAQPTRRRLSPEGRAAISKAAKKRWAQYRADKRRQKR